MPVTSGQSPHQTASQLEAFERFAETSTAPVTWSQEAGRIDLSEGDRKDQVYIRKEHLDRAIDGLGEIARFPESPSEDSDTPDRCRGSELFWRQQGHAFAASECTLGTLDDWVGLVVHDHQQGNFHFTDKEAEDFAKVLVAAKGELKKNSPRP